MLLLLGVAIEYPAPPFFVSSSSREIENENWNPQPNKDQQQRVIEGKKAKNEKLWIWSLNYSI